MGIEFMGRDMSREAASANKVKQMSLMKAEEKKLMAEIALEKARQAERSRLLALQQQAANIQEAQAPDDSGPTAPVDAAVSPSSDASMVTADTSAAPLMGFDMKKNLPLVIAAAAAGFLFLTKPGKKLMRKFR